MGYEVPVGIGQQHSSGRVIALGRLMLAILFLLAIWIDASQPTRAPDATYAILTSYVFLSLGIAIATWRNWWLDAHLAGPAHAVDIMLFAIIVLLTEGYTSPFFTFFIFLLFSAAIRWGWHATALTAILLTLLYLIVGMAAFTAGTSFEPHRFIVRTGHLVILSLLLIWFGASQQRGRSASIADPLVRPSLHESPLEVGLRAAMDHLRAARGILLWREGTGTALPYSGLAIRNKKLAAIDKLPADALPPSASATPFLYEVKPDRALKRDAGNNLVGFSTSEQLHRQATSGLSLSRGLAVPVVSEGGEGWLFLESIRGLSTDHIGLGEQIAADIAAHIQGHALLKAAEEGAEARSRLTLARDLHDSVVQFLAGIAFRLEALKRSNQSGRDVTPDIDELKQLLIQEQRELRSFITALRSGPLVPLSDLEKDLTALAQRLSRQWDVRCELAMEPADMMIPTRLRLESQQLMREAVANAVRHAQAKWVEIDLDLTPYEMRLEFVNDGADFPAGGKRPEMPTSLKERVEQAGGTIDLARGMGVTRLSIALPIGERHL